MRERYDPTEVRVPQEKPTRTLVRCGGCGTTIFDGGPPTAGILEAALYRLDEHFVKHPECQSSGPFWSYQ